MPTWLATLPQQALIWLVRGYRFFLSAWIGNVCRYSPSCSAYSLQALQTHGALVGSCLTVHRIVRCNPFCLGGHDPVPERPYRLFGDWFHDPSPRPSSAHASVPPSTSIDKTPP